MMMNTTSMIHDARYDCCDGDGGGHVQFIYKVQRRRLWKMLVQEYLKKIENI